MSGSLETLGLAAFLFVATHLVLPTAAVRGALVGQLGENGYLGLYSLISLALLGWMISAYGSAPEVTLFEPNTGMRHAALTLMLVACFLFVGGLTAPNPTLAATPGRGLEDGPRGVLKITRHPLMWSFGLWGGAHLLANGDAAAWILFGSIAFLALAGTLHIDARKRARLGQAWSDFEGRSSNLPLAAIAKGRTRMEGGEFKWWQTALTLVLYGVLLIGHGLAGRDVLPSVFP